MANKQGDFIWYELLASDVAAARAFYGPLLGWTTIDSGQANLDYHLIQASDTRTGEVHGVGGMLQLSGDMCSAGARTAWLGYIAVDNVDATVERMRAAGGAVQMPATDIPAVGRIAMVTDPQGAPFYVMKPIPPAGQPDATSLAFAHDQPRPGHCAWNELTTPDQDAAWRFYSGQFGWTEDGALEMGPGASYQFIRHGGVIGAIAPTEKGAPAIWTYYFRVPDIDAAVAGIAAGGGELTYGPSEIPGEEFIVQGIDPQGAAFALVGVRL